MTAGRNARLPKKTKGGSVTLLIDTREKETCKYLERIESIGLPYERRKLDFGDYSAKCSLPDGEEADLSGRFAIERKMGIDECCSCFGKERARFEREFVRAKKADARIYLLIENASWEKIIAHDYRSRMAPVSLIGSLLAWQIRYDMRIVMCGSGFSGKLIKSIVDHEVKECLKNLF